MQLREPEDDLEKLTEWKWGALLEYSTGLQECRETRRPHGRGAPSSNHNSQLRLTSAFLFTRVFALNSNCKHVSSEPHVRRPWGETAVVGSEPEFWADNRRLSDGFNFRCSQVKRPFRCGGRRSLSGHTDPPTFEDNESKLALVYGMNIPALQPTESRLMSSASQNQLKHWVRRPHTYACTRSQMSRRCDEIQTLWN